MESDYKLIINFENSLKRQDWNWQPFDFDCGNLDDPVYIYYEVEMDCYYLFDVLFR